MPTWADTPPKLDLSPTFQYCVDKPAAQKIEECFEQNTACHENLKKDHSPDAGLVVVVGIGAAILGFFLRGAVH